ncbi:MAG: hypothetical protein HY313_08905 [Acidobacteria bacterium]|nr:hypothetical protein [Acidobacteriota bacterium]
MGIRGARSRGMGLRIEMELMMFWNDAKGRPLHGEKGSAPIETRQGLGTGV